MTEETSLYLVPTPIGNLQDITLRAINVLKEVDVVLAEDTRTSGKLLKHLEVNKPLRSYHIHNEHQKLPAIISELESGTKMALVSDAGTPAISDPGFLLVRECLKHQIKIECLPGATAFVPALVKSGFATDRFVFEGFLPHKKGRQTRLQQVAEESRTVVLYESPHRLIKALKQLEEVLLPDRRVSVSRELTKIYEETVTGTPAELLAHYDQGTIKGEIVIVIEGKQ
ncbi:MAG: 16S rRNA (cytidine(1402)-2'-O)-methyltransferase [Bacteroidota bacterium]